MQATVAEELSIETEWLREYASAYLPCEGGFKFTPEMFRREAVSIVDIRNVFRHGVVTYADKLDEPGALWIVRGYDGDGGYIVAEIVVVSETYDVDVRNVKRVL
ncbi:MAG: hypothetical protein ACR652_14995 [Methylocystis sp.]|uniref:hypothetical protein n=1 Tax=Methylocystis sp. TaxID=1911079 RepID=UPI003DA5A9CB